MKKNYDFTGGVRGKHAAEYARGTNIVLLEPDVARSFPDSRSVNEALRALSVIAKRQAKLSKPAAGAATEPEITEIR